MDKLTHWKTYCNPDYLGAYAFQPGEEKILTIKNVVREFVQMGGGKGEECTVAHFAEREKPMVINRTNCKTITKLYATPYIEQWVGKRIRVYVTKTKLKGEEVDCLRIRPEIPQVTLPELTPEHQHWAAAVKAIREGTNNVDGIRKYYRVAPDMAKMLTEEAKSA